MSSEPIISMWVVLPLASVALLVQAGYLMVLKELPVGAMPASRKRIRTASGWMSMFAIPLSAYGFGFATMDEPSVFVIVWMVVIGLIGGILMLAGLDSINTMRLHRKAKDSMWSTASRCGSSKKHASGTKVMTKPVPSPTRIPNFITRAMSWAYGLGIARVNKRFDRGVGVTKLEVPVISVGNLSAGGTGKSPTVHWVARQVQKLGKQPLIAMRGYKAQAGQMGDEEREHRTALPGVEVVAQSDRLSGIHSMIEGGAAVDCVILDDGFQHRQIARDLDIVLIDASSPPYHDALLPRGFLREPGESLARAHAVLITHCEMVGDDELAMLTEWIETQKPSFRVCVSSHDWVGIQTYKVALDEHGKADWPEGAYLDQLPAEARVLGVCAIGNPDGFFSMIEQSEAELVEQIVLRDHASYDERSIKNILDKAEKMDADAICMTRKDWVKACDGLLGRCTVPVWVPELGIRFHSGESELGGLISKLLGVTNRTISADSCSDES